jgi:uncharacterized membrane protein YfcA
MLDYYVYPLAILAGIVAGIVNTLAGSGSLITLPMLVFLGLPSNVANATNRVGVVMQNLVGATTFYRSGKLNLSNSHWLVIASIPGALAGAWAASSLGEAQMDIIIGVIMVVMLFVILFEPEKWLRQHSDVRDGRPSIWILLIFVGIGFYGGFIQASVGVLTLAALVLGMNYSLAHANAIKLILILVVTLVAMVVFVNENLIEWGPGLLVALGQSIGAWLAARFATRSQNAAIWTRRLLIAVVVIAIFQFFGILDYILAAVGLA